jgi:hypothetical protein
VRKVAPGFRGLLEATTSVRVMPTSRWCWGKWRSPSGATRRGLASYFGAASILVRHRQNIACLEVCRFYHLGRLVRASSAYFTHAARL